MINPLTLRSDVEADLVAHHLPAEARAALLDRTTAVEDLPDALVGHEPPLLTLVGTGGPNPCAYPTSLGERVTKALRRWRADDA